MRACGLSREAIRWRRSQGRLHRVLPRVYAIGSPRLQPLAAHVAALLHAGDDAFLGYRTGVELWGMIPPAPGEPIVELGIVGRRVASRANLAAHYVPEIDLTDLRLHRGLPVSAPARSLIDFAGQAAVGELERALNEARVLGLVTDAQIQAAIERDPRRRGVRRLRALLASESETQMTRSDLERRCRRLFVAAQLPAPLFNARVLSYEVDVLWPRERVIVELDGIAAHGRPRAFHADRRRDQSLVAAGYVVLRVTFRQLVDEPLAVAVRIAQTLTVARTRLNLMSAPARA